MGFTEFLLRPYQKWFNAPEIEIPFSTIPMPDIKITTVLVFASFFIIVGGNIFCFVNGIPTYGYERGQDGKPVLVWISSNNLSYQFVAEGVIASMVFSVGAGAMIAMFYVLNKKGELSEIENVLKYYAATAPLWILVSLILFRVKIPSYAPSFTAR